MRLHYTTLRPPVLRLAAALMLGLALVASSQELTEKGKQIQETYGSLGLRHHNLPTQGYAPGAMSVKGRPNPPPGSYGSYGGHQYQGYGYRRSVRRYRW